MNERLRCQTLSEVILWGNLVLVREAERVLSWGDASS